MSHIEVDDIIGSFDDKKKEEAIRKHIKKCERCKSLYDEFYSTFSSNEHAEAIPSSRVKERIFDTYNSVKLEEEKKREKRNVSIFSFISKPAFIWSAGFAFAAILISFTLLITKESEPALKIKIVKGDVTVNDKRINKTVVLSPGSRIKVGPNSVAKITDRKNLRVIVSENSVLDINRSVKSEKTHLNLSLKKGRLLSKYRNRDEKIAYTYTTPHTHIQPIKSELMINAEEEKTVVIVKKGQAEIESKETEENLVACADEKYIVSSQIDSGTINDEDNLMIDGIKSEYLNNGIEGETGTNFDEAEM